MAEAVVMARMVLQQLLGPGPPATAAAERAPGAGPNAAGQVQGVAGPPGGAAGDSGPVEQGHGAEGVDPSGTQGAAALALRLPVSTAGAEGICPAEAAGEERCDNRIYGPVIASHVSYVGQMSQAGHTKQHAVVAAAVPVRRAGSTGGRRLLLCWIHLIDCLRFHCFV